MLHIEWGDSISYILDRGDGSVESTQEYKTPFEKSKVYSAITDTVDPDYIHTWDKYYSGSNYKPEKDGYIFDGWYKDEGLKDKVEAIMVTDDITLYAKWKMNLANEVRNPDTSDGMNIYIILLFFASLLVLVVTIVQKYFFYE